MNLLFACFSCWFLMSPILLASEMKIAIQPRKPESYFEDGKFKGPLVTILDRLQKDIGINSEYVLMPWARILHTAKLSVPILLTRHSMTKEREDYLIPILFAHEERFVYFIKSRKRKFNPTVFKDLNNYRVGGRRGAFYSKKFNESKEINRVLVNSDNQLLMMLKLNRIDLAASYLIREYEEAAKEEGLNFDKEFEVISYHERFLNGRYFSMPKGAGLETIHPRLNCQVLKYRKSGYITKVYEKANLKPYIQDFKNPESLQQEKECQGR